MVCNIDKKPLHEWTKAELKAVARALNVKMSTAAGSPRTKRGLWQAIKAAQAGHGAVRTQCGRKAAGSPRGSPRGPRSPRGPYCRKPGTLVKGGHCPKSKPKSKPKSQPKSEPSIDVVLTAEPSIDPIPIPQSSDPAIIPQSSMGPALAGPQSMDLTLTPQPSMTPSATVQSGTVAPIIAAVEEQVQAAVETAVQAVAQGASAVQVQQILQQPVQDAVAVTGDAALVHEQVQVAVQTVAQAVVTNTPADILMLKGAVTQAVNQAQAAEDAGLVRDMVQGAVKRAVNRAQANANNAATRAMTQAAFKRGVNRAQANENAAKNKVKRNQAMMFNANNPFPLGY